MRDVDWCVIDRLSATPLYVQVADAIGAAIGTPALPEGERLPGEDELAQMLGISRITLRKALALLMERRLIVRQQGKGTFVRSAVIRHDLHRLDGMLSTLLDQAPGGAASLLEYAEAEPPADVARQMRIEPGGTALRVVRLYRSGEVPVAVARVWMIREAMIEDRTIAERTSTAAMLARIGVGTMEVEIVISAVSGDSELRELLDLPAHAPLLQVGRERTGYDGRIKEVGDIYLRSEAFNLVLSSRSLASSDAAVTIRARSR